MNTLARKSIPSTTSNTDNHETETQLSATSNTDNHETETQPSATSNTDNNETNTTPATANDESTNDGEGVSLVNDRDEGGNVDSSRADMIDNVNED